MKPIARNAMVVATLIVLSGCAGKQRPVTPNDPLSLSSYPHFIAIHHPPSAIFTLSYGFGAPLVAIPLAVSEAARLEGDMRLEDPAPYFKERFVNALQTNFKLTNVRPASEYPQNLKIALETYSETIRKRGFWDGKAAWKPDWDKEAPPCVPSPGTVCGPEDEVRLSRLRLNNTLKETFPNSIVLEVQTTRWALDSTARVVYEAAIRLFRLSDSVVIWRRPCRGFAEVRVSEVPDFDERRKPHPTMGQQRPDQIMMEELQTNGKLLKAKLREAAEACADNLLRAHLGIEPPALPSVRDRSGQVVKLRA